MGKIKLFADLSFHLKVMLLEAFIWSILANLAIKFLPLKTYRRYLDSKQGKDLSRVDEDIIFKIAKDFRIVLTILSKNVPWEIKCYARAIIAKQLFRRKGLHSTITLGLTKLENNQLIAHAWLSHHNRCIIGHNGQYQFVRMAEF